MEVGFENGAISILLIKTKATTMIDIGNADEQMMVMRDNSTGTVAMVLPTEAYRENGRVVESEMLNTVPKGERRSMMRTTKFI